MGNPASNKRRVSRIGVLIHVRTLEPTVIADLDTLLTALYVELTDCIIPSLLARAECGDFRPLLCQVKGAGSHDKPRRPVAGVGFDVGCGQAG